MRCCFQSFAELDSLGDEANMQPGAGFVRDIEGGQAFVVPGCAAIEGNIETNVFPGTGIAECQRVAPIPLELDGGVELVEQGDVTDAAEALEGRVGGHVQDYLDGLFGKAAEVIGVCEKEFAQVLACQIGVKCCQVNQFQSRLQLIRRGSDLGGGHIHSSSCMGRGPSGAWPWQGNPQQLVENGVAGWGYILEACESAFERIVQGEAAAFQNVLKNLWGMREERGRGLDYR